MVLTFVQKHEIITYLKNKTNNNNKISCERYLDFEFYFENLNNNKTES